jgi:hypothetical protein
MGRNCFPSWAAEGASAELRLEAKEWLQKEGMLLYEQWYKVTDLKNWNCKNFLYLRQLD